MDRLFKHASDSLKEKFKELEAKLAAAKTEIEKVKRHSCCKYPGYCGGECTCKTCAPELHIIEFEHKLTAAEAEIDRCHKDWDRAASKISEMRVELEKASELVKQLQDALSVTAANLTAAAERIKRLEELLKEAEYILRHDKYIRLADSISAALEVKNDIR